MSYTEAIAYFNGIITGTVLFRQYKNKQNVTVIFDIEGPPNKEYACHIHEYGDLRRGCKSLGPHWNPHNTTHGYTFDTSRPSHAGDLVGNIILDESGIYRFIYQDHKITLYDPLSIIGRSIVIHDGIDDLGLGGNEESLKTGNAGGRIDCAIIGRANNNLFEYQLL